MKTRPDGSAFRRGNVAYGRQPTQPRPRNDGFHWATPRHPACSRLTVCNRLVYFKYANFGGRCLEINYKLQISVILRHFDQANSLRHFDQAKRVEKSPRKRPSYNCVIARSERSAVEISLCRANHFTFPTK